MENRLIHLAALLVATVLLGCSNSHNPDRALAEKRAQLGQTEILGGISFFKEENDTYVADRPLESIASGANYSIQIELEPQGTFELVSHAQQGLKNGFSLLFARTADSTNLKMIAKVGTEVADWSAAFAAVNPAHPFLFSIDIHNDEEGAAHVMIWDGEVLLLDSTETATPASPGLGQGQLWGVKINSSTVTSITRSEPRHED